MKERRLLRIIGLLDDALIEAAAEKPRRKNVWVRWAALAACIALLAAAPLALKLRLGPTKGAQEDAAGPEISDNTSAEITMEKPDAAYEPEGAAEDVAESVDEDLPAQSEEESAGLDAEAPMPEQEAPDEAEEEEVEPPAEEAKEETAANDAQDMPDAEPEAAPGTASEPAVAAALRIGDVYLGMPEAAVYELFGAPKFQSNTGPAQIGPYRYVTYFYDLGGAETGASRDLSLGMVDTGDGFVVNEIFTLRGCPLRLQDSGIGIGSTEAEVRDAYPDAAFEPEMDGEAYCTIGRGYRWLQIRIVGGVVKYLYYGTFVPTPAVSDEVEPPRDENDLPAYIPVGGSAVFRHLTEGWELTTQSDYSAKRLETNLNIDGLLPQTQTPAGEPVLEIEMESGWRVAFYLDGSEAARVTDDRGQTYEVRFYDGVVQEILNAIAAGDL